MTEYRGVPVDYDRRSKDPSSWYSVGFSLYFAANLLWKRLRPALAELQPGVTEFTPEQELALRLRGPFAMLAGMAIEVMLKGAIVEAALPKERAAPPQTHNLVTLSARAKQSWDASQIDLLERLTTFVVWAGRYPVATNAQKSQAPRILRSTDYATIADVAGRLVRLHQRGRQ